MRVEFGAAPRPCVVAFGDGDAPAERHNALFHFWAVKQHPKPAVFAGESAGQVSFPVGVVEYEDGTVHEVRPQRIRFLDDMHSQYCFGGVGDGDALA